VEEVDEHTCVVVVDADSARTVAVYLSLLELDFTVTEPPELVEWLRVLADRYRRAVPAQLPAASTPGLGK
jgi:hypothetical protein